MVSWYKTNTRILEFYVLTPCTLLRVLWQGTHNGTSVLVVLVGNQNSISDILTTNISNCLDWIQNVGGLIFFLYCLC